VAGVYLLEKPVYLGERGGTIGKYNLEGKDENGTRKRGKCKRKKEER
jgi:hypothetical protein